MAVRRPAVIAERRPARSTTDEPAIFARGNLISDHNEHKLLIELKQILFSESRTGRRIRQDRPDFAKPSMPRYFFNLHDDLELSDDDGVELPDLEAAQSMAVHYAGSILKEAGRRLRLGEVWTLEVYDTAERPLFRIDLQIRSVS